MPRFKQTICIDDYVLDVLMHDLIGHDRKPAAYLVYLHLYGQAVRNKWKPATLGRPHNRRRNRALQERRARGAHTFAAPTTNRDDR